MMGLLYRLFGRKVSTFRFSAKRISKTEFRVTFDNDTETIMSEADVKTLLQMSDTELNGLGFKFNGPDAITDYFKSLLHRFLDDARAKKSRAGERVTLRIVEEVAQDLPENMVRKSGRYDVVGDSGKVYQTESFRCDFDKDKTDLLDLYKVLTQLAWSGTHATNEDVLRYYEVVGSEIPDAYKSENEVQSV